MKSVLCISYPPPLLLFCGILMGVYEVVSVYYCIGRIIRKAKIIITDLLLLTLLMTIFLLKYPHTITVISRRMPLVFISVAGYGCYCQDFSIWNIRLRDDLLWKLFCWLLRLFSTKTIYIVPVIPLYMELFSTLVTSYIWPGNLTSTRSSTTSTIGALK